MPADWGLAALSTWSLSTLRDHLLDRGTVTAISRETLGRILHDGGSHTEIAAYIRWRNTRTRPKTGFATDSPQPHLDPIPTKAA